MPGRSSTSRPPSRHRFARMANPRAAVPSPTDDDIVVSQQRSPPPIDSSNMPPRSKTRPLHLHPHSTTGSNDENTNSAIPQRTSSLQQISALHWPGGGPIASAASRTFQSSPNDAVAGAMQDLPDDVFAAIDDESMAELPVYEDSQASAMAAAAPTTMMTTANSSTHNTTTTHRPRSELGMALQQHRPSLPANLSHAQSSRPTSTTGMGMAPPASQTRRSAPPTHTVSSPSQRNHGGNRGAWSTSSPSGSHRSSSPTTDMALMPPPRGPAAAAAASTSHNGGAGTSTTNNRKAPSPSNASQNAHANATASSSSSSSSNANANVNPTSSGVPPQSYAFRTVQRELSCAQAKNRRYLSVIDELERTVAMLKRGGAGGAGGAAAAAAAEERVAAAAAALAAEGGDDGRSPPSSGNAGR